MNGTVIYTAVSGIDEAYLADTENMAQIKAENVKARKRKQSVLVGICACSLFILGIIGVTKIIDTSTIQTPVVIPPTSTPSQPVPTTEAGTTRSGLNEEPTSCDPAAVVPPTGRGTTQEETSHRQADAPTHGETPENGTEPTAPIPGTTDGREAEPATTIDPPTVPEDEVVFYQLYTYVIVSSTFSDYRLGKAVGEESVGQRLEDAAATGVYVNSDGTIQEDETLRCEIFALTGVDSGIAVCVRFIDRGKGLKTDRYYLLYHPDADMSAIEASLIP